MEEYTPQLTTPQQQLDRLIYKCGMRKVTARAFDKYASKKDKDSLRIVMQLLKDDPEIFAYASSRLRENPALLYMALEQYCNEKGHALQDPLYDVSHVYGREHLDNTTLGNIYCGEQKYITAGKMQYDQELEAQLNGTDYPGEDDYLLHIGTSGTLPEEVIQGYNKWKKDREQLSAALSKKTVVTHFGADLDNVASIEALERYARENGILEEGEHLEVLRVPAGKVMEGYLNVDTGGHKGSRIEDGETIVIDGDPSNGVNSAAAMLSTLGVYVPEQIVELADTVPNKVNPLESRTALSLIRSAGGATIFEMAEAGLLDKQLTDEQLKQYGLEDAHKKQKEIIEKAVEKINKYMKTLPNGEKIVIAPEQILGGAPIAYELGANFYTSAEPHKSGEGSTFAITSKPGIQLPEEIKEFGRGLVEQYKNSDGTSGVFLNPNGQMLVAGGPKNPDFAVEYTLDEIVSKITELFGIEETKPHTYQGIAGMLEGVKKGEFEDTLQQLVKMGEPDKAQEDGKLPTDND